MKALLVLSPALLGVLGVLQAGLNRRIAGQWSLTSAAVLNTSVLLPGAIILLFLLGGHRTVDFKTFAPWYVVPGLAGLLLVLGGPLAVARFGAAQTFVIVIAGQLVASALWDLKMEGIPLTSTRVAGIALAWLGAFVATWKK